MHFKTIEQKKKEIEFCYFRFLNSLILPISCQAYTKLSREFNAPHVNKTESYNGRKLSPKPKEEHAATRNSMYTINILKNTQKDQNGAI